MKQKIKHYKTVEEFVSKQRELLKLEQDEEVAERHQTYENKPIKELVKRGICVNRLQLDHQKTGLFGKHMVIFNLSCNENVTSHRLSPGDIVGLYPNKGASGDIIASGLVSSTRSRTISVAFTEGLDLASTSLYRLMKLTNDVTYRRMNKSLHMISKQDTNMSAYINILFPCKPVVDQYINSNIKINKFFNNGLDTSQKDAVTFAVSSSLPLSVIHGPPGTGKTTTVVEIVQQQVKNFQKKILVCAPSNIAVDNIVERLAKAKIKVVRLGHPARVIEDVQKYSLDAIIDSHDSSSVIRELKAEISEKCSSKAKGGSKQKWDDVKLLRKDLVKREEQLTRSILTGTDVVLATLTGASGEGPLKFVKDDHFDLLIIDEAAQAMEVSCWIPLLKVKRCILAGDHLQLPPTIISEKAAKAGLEVTLLERVVHGLGENAVKMLTKQYRMNQLIMEWPSKELYESKLVAADMVAGHLLCHLEGVCDTENTRSPLVFVDTAGHDMHELNNQEEESKGNTWEVDIVFKHIQQLVDDGVPMKHIGVITPYNLQVDLIRKAVLPHFPQVEVNSVDGFQGREKEAILISLVRSNEDGEVGFLREDRRLNVAVTRARRHLFVVGDTSTISRHPFLESFSTYMFEKAVVRMPSLQDVNDGIGSTTSDVAEDGGKAALKNEPDVSQFELPPMPKPSTTTKQQLVLVSTATKSPVEHNKENMQAETNKTNKSIKTSTSAKVKGIEQPTEDELKKTIEDFVASQTNNKQQNQTSQKTKKLEFPTTLTSRERAWVHELAETFELEHTSVGEGNKRHIVIWKRNENESESDDQEKSVKKDANQDQQTKDTPSSHLTCPSCRAQVPLKNFELHSVRCIRQQQQNSELQAAAAATAASSTKKKKAKSNTTTATNSNKQQQPNQKKTGGKKQQQNKAEEEEDIDSILNEFKQLHTTCSYGTTPHGTAPNAQQKCKKSIKIMGQKCEFCGHVYCLTHHMAEVHGCGDAVRVKARRDNVQYGAACGSGAKPKVMKSAAKAHAQRKLDKRLDEMQKERKKKNSGAEKK